MKNTEPWIRQIVQITKQCKITKTLTVNSRGCHCDVSPISRPFVYVWRGVIIYRKKKAIQRIGRWNSGSIRICCSVSTLRLTPPSFSKSLRLFFFYSHTPFTLSISRLPLDSVESASSLLNCTNRVSRATIISIIEWWIKWLFNKLKQFFCENILG